MMNHVRDALSLYLSQSWNSNLEQPEAVDLQSDPDSAGDVDSASPDPEKRVLKKITPKKNVNTWSCNHCSKVFTNAESYNKHQKENKLNEKVAIPKVTCMLLKKGTEKRCTSKQTLSLKHSLKAF